MFVRRSATRNLATGESYFTYRLVRSERVEGKVRQVTLLNLGRHFDLKQDHWPMFCQRIEELLSSQPLLVPTSLPVRLEQAAQRYASLLIARSSTIDIQSTDAKPREPAYQEVDCDSLKSIRPRSVGVEHVGLHAMTQLGFVEKLGELGVPAGLRLAAIGNVIARMAAPASELATYHWLCTHSALGELIDTDFEAMPLMRLYRASDQLVKHREAIEQHLFERVRSLFTLEATVTLYDLTNTYFEGQCEANGKAKPGRSKEKRSDCPLVTLGVVLDTSGFIRRSRMFEGNAVEARTLQTMLDELKAPPNAMVIMDKGIATAANLAWLVEHGYRYLVASRAGARQFDVNQATAIDSASGETIHIQKQISDDGKEVRLYCHSTGREKKERAIDQCLALRFEAGLTQLAEGLLKPRGEKRYDKVMERIGRLKQKSRGMSRHYGIELIADADGKKARSLTFTKQPVDGTRLTHPGVYVLATNELSWDEEKLWRTYTMLTDLEAVFRSLKSELGLRPVYHTKQDRADGHLFITVLAYQLVQVARTQLKQHGIHDSWSTLRSTLSVQRRVTATFRRRDGRTLHVRNTTDAEPELLKLYNALGVNPAPGGIRKLIV
jgi:transposase